ncbi:MAG TPA: vanadium-dependent haloperoxidase [Gemmatimonadaceae bacterium]|nr:vanadium-dependent haloperoxidase [Gemmatimonadaceae bacterium]
MPALSRRAARWAATLPIAALVVACGEPAATVAPQAASTTRVVTSAEPVATVKWNEVARGLVMKYNTSAPATIRMFALLTVAEYNAVVGTEKAKQRSLHPVDRGAVAGASAAVLSYVYPQEAAYLEGLVDQQETSVVHAGTRHEDFASGEAIGRTVAAGVIERAKTDGFFAPFTGTVPTCAGCWLPTTPPAFATLGQAKTFFLASNDQFRPAPPPAFDSPAFAAALAEVRHIADTRTTEQDSIARFWALGAGTISAQGYLNGVASDLAVQYHLSERETAHRLALMNMAAYDALVASHEAKYHYWLIRPSQADPAIVRAIPQPSFPSYPSNHSALVGSAATVLGALFPSERARLEAMVEVGAISRLYAGIHYRFDTQAGFALGRQIATWTLAHDIVGHQPFVLG